MERGTDWKNSSEGYGSCGREARGEAIVEALQTRGVLRMLDSRECRIRRGEPCTQQPGSVSARGQQSTRVLGRVHGCVGAAPEGETGGSSERVLRRRAKGSGVGGLTRRCVADVAFTGPALWCLALSGNPRRKLSASLQHRTLSTRRRSGTGAQTRRYEHARHHRHCSRQQARLNTCTMWYACGNSRGPRSTSADAPQQARPQRPGRHPRALL